MNSPGEIISAVFAALRREWILALGRTAPNPAVAAAILAETDDGPRIFSGGTEIPGGRHAEIVALDRYDAFVSGHRRRERVRPRRMYVSLEPCSHHGRTPPCTDRILQYPDLLDLAVLSPDPSLPESGCEILRAAGRRVHLRASRRSIGFEMLAGFRSRVGGRGPRLHFKLAVSSDGVMGLGDRRLMISGTRALQVGQLMRAKLDAVLVGPGTIAVDRPSLALRPEAIPAYADAEPGAGHIFAPADPDSGGGDLFWDSLRGCEATVRANIAATPAAYQPERVFILGRPPGDAVGFLRSQSDARRSTGRSSRFAALPACLPLWRPAFEALAVENTTSRRESAEEANDQDPGDVHELPGLDDAAFAGELRAWLGALGYNEVLVEGGAGLHRSLLRGASAEDRITVLRSKRDFAALVAAGGGGAGRDLRPIPAPAELFSRPIGARYDLGDDVLEQSQSGSGRRTELGWPGGGGPVFLATEL